MESTQVPLNTLGRLFPEFAISSQVELVCEPAWMYAWRMEAWHSESPSNKAAYLLVYRSPLVKCTAPEYEPVAQALLDAERHDVLGEGVIEDPNMMFGEGEFCVSRLSSADFLSPISVDEIRSIITEVMSGAPA
ncbi:hypothetical protein SEA_GREEDYLAWYER_72 [Mycobacterium phage GreedyLawyer]|uniref:Uncharacterized protein n=3 Tax=Gladiatorvirus TaxID=2948726 RepID=G1EBU8_9CAUD|nr:hypothetical protein AXJ19_gp035 [Mycobacterium phage VohminGhazi]YP_009637880.1 hypothetical protein FGG32_gp033 [Mycobacterium phage EricB]YP_010061209.1 hypothetical protein KIP54_gp27 [Mycobacterium phage JewelBug]AMW64426.1 hypothetical protein PBI_KAZAN_78 [Mycobacterium phage Kazan]AVR76931.1 hypothetical protein SEA_GREEDYLAWYER_72 [Mycobacterium phage GreedyLawyer]AEJ93357.1 hypothetical protein ERICB_76 [Mycobacterium phage EricB]AIS73650.1 hypothetical protein PBI_VOHMINGHAZI_77